MNLGSRALYEIATLPEPERTKEHTTSNMPFRKPYRTFSYFTIINTFLLIINEYERLCGSVFKLHAVLVATSFHCINLWSENQ